MPIRVLTALLALAVIGIAAILVILPKWRMRPGLPHGAPAISASAPADDRPPIGATLVARWLAANTDPARSIALADASILGADPGAGVRRLGDVSAGDEAARAAADALLKSQPDYVLIALRRSPSTNPGTPGVEPLSDADGFIAGSERFYVEYYRPRPAEADAGPLESLAAEIGALVVLEDRDAGLLVGVYAREAQLQLQSRDPLEVLRAIRRGDPNAFCPVCRDKRHAGNYHNPMP